MWCFIISRKNLRSESLDSFELDSAYYLSTAVYSWVSMPIDAKYLIGLIQKILI